MALGCDGKDVVSELSAVIPAGDITVINGPSGAGKTTVLNGVLGFIKPSAGRILIGEQDLADIDVRQWWSHIAWVPQSPQLLPTSLRENITMGEDLDVREVGSDPAGGLGRCPADGLDTIIGEGGRPVSVGQARRIALARATAALPRAPAGRADRRCRPGVRGRDPRCAANRPGDRDRGRSPSAIDAIADHTFSVGVVV